MAILNEDQISRMTEQYPRGWISHYWEELCLIAPELSFSDKRDAFFCLVERMLREGKLKFDDPAMPSRFWGASAEDILAYLRSGWPSGATSENDDPVFTYFYLHAPPASWLGEDGQWHGS